MENEPARRYLNVVDRETIREFYLGAEGFVTRWTSEVVGDSSELIDGFDYPRPTFYRRHVDLGAMTVDTTGRVRKILHENGFSLDAPWHCGPLFVPAGEDDPTDEEFRAFDAEHRHATRDEAIRCAASRGGERIEIRRDYEGA